MITAYEAAQMLHLQFGEFVRLLGVEDSEESKLKRVTRNDTDYFDSSSIVGLARKRGIKVEGERKEE